jgi:hypothetical protein
VPARATGAAAAQLLDRVGPTSTLATPATAPLPEIPTAIGRGRTLSVLAAHLATCAVRHGRHLRVVVRYEGATGAATWYRVAGRFFATPEMLTCVDASIHAAPMPPFRRPTWTTDYAIAVR